MEQGAQAVGDARHLPCHSDAVERDHLGVVAEVGRGPEDPYSDRGSNAEKHHAPDSRRHELDEEQQRCAGREVDQADRRGGLERGQTVKGSSLERERGKEPEAEESLAGGC